MSKTDEAEFLESYFKLISNSKGEQNMSAFVENVKKTLAGQISPAILDAFEQTYYLRKAIAVKQDELNKLEAKLGKYEKVLTARKAQAGDPCGHSTSSSSHSGGC